MSTKPRPCALLCAKERDAEIERLTTERDALRAIAAGTQKMLEQARSERDALRGALVLLVAIARRYLPEYDENPEIQKADDALAAGEER